MPSRAWAQLKGLPDWPSVSPRRLWAEEPHRRAALRMARAGAKMRPAKTYHREVGGCVFISADIGP